MRPIDTYLQMRYITKVNGYQVIVHDVNVYARSERNFKLGNVRDVVYALLQTDSMSKVMSLGGLFMW